MNALHFFFGLGAFLSPLLVAQVLGIEGGYRWAYWGLAVLAALAGLLMLTLSNSPKPVHAPSSGSARQVAKRIPVVLVVSAALFLFFYVGAEISFSGWVYTYATTLHLASATGAAYLTSAFWLSFTVGRLLSIPAATHFKPQQVIPVAVFFCLVFLGLGIVIPGSGLILWIVAIGLGFCMAPVWPTGFTFAGQSLDLSGKIAGLVLLGDSFGGMVLPWLIGQVIDTTGPQSMVFLIFGSLVLNLLAFGVMLKLRQAKKTQEHTLAV